MSFVHFKNGAHGLAEENGCVKWKLKNSRCARPETIRFKVACFRVQVAGWRLQAVTTDPLSPELRRDKWGWGCPDAKEIGKHRGNSVNPRKLAGKNEKIGFILGSNMALLGSLLASFWGW